MSVGFRIFVLIVLAFAALWIYRFREPELERLFAGFQTQAQDASFASNDVAVMHLRRPVRQFMPPVDPSSLGSPDWAPDGMTWDPLSPEETAEYALLADLPPGEVPPQEHIPGFEYDANGQVILPAPPDPDLLPPDEEVFDKDLKSDGEILDTDVKPLSESGEQRVSSRTHAVAEKETLSRIARKYFPDNSKGVTLLFEANKDRLGLKSPNEIFAGQVLVIPSAAKSRAVTRDGTTQSE